jgi:arylsulfate sulfotransferase
MHPSTRFVPFALTLAWLPLACHDGGSGSSGSPTIDVTPPEILQGPDIAPNPNPQVPLAAIVTLVTDEPAWVTLHVSDGVNAWNVTPEPAPVLDHSLWVLGLRPDRAHQVLVEVTDVAGNAALSPNVLSFVTDPLPAPFPPIQVTVSEPALMEPGVTLFDARFDNLQLPGLDWGLLVAVDAQGEVVWYYRYDQQIFDARRLPNGNMLFNYRLPGSGVAEVDMLGDFVQGWHVPHTGFTPISPQSIPLTLESVHHEIFPMPAGSGSDFLTLSTEMRPYAGYPKAGGGFGPANVIGDVVAEYLRDGTVTREISLLDVLDPYRVSYDSLTGFWDRYYGTIDTDDWAHANSVVYDPATDLFVVSLRHQEAVIAIDRPSGELRWILGTHDGWGLPWSDKLLTPISPVFEWPYHQHAASITPHGTVLLFDNGNGRAFPPAPQLPEVDRYSRAVEYRVDPVAMTVEQLWAYGGPNDKWYSAFLCDADWLPQTGNVLVVDGAKSNGGPLYARLVEVTHTDPAVVVWEIFVKDVDPPIEFSWNVYRGERLPSIDPAAPLIPEAPQPRL